MSSSRWSRGGSIFSATITFAGQAIYDAETLRGQMLDLLSQPYTDGRLADIPRRLQAYYKARGYFAVKVDAVGAPNAARDGRVPVRVTIAAGPVYYFDGVTVTGLERLRPSYVTNRFRKLSGKPYSPDVLDDKFRALMRTGLFNVLQIKPLPTDGNMLRLQISAEEAKSKEFGFSLGYGSYVGALVGASYRDRNLFGSGRPLNEFCGIHLARLQRGNSLRGSIPLRDGEPPEDSISGLDLRLRRLFQVRGRRTDRA